MQLEAVLELEYATLFDHDPDGRLAPVDRSGNPAPDLTIGRTDGAVVHRLRSDLPDGLAAELTGFAASESVTGSLEGSPRFDREYRRLLGLGDTTPEVYVAFVIEDGRPEDEPPEGPVVSALEGQPEAALREFPGLVTDLERRLPGFAVLRDGKAVAVAFSSRSVAGAAEAGVETVPPRNGWDKVAARYSEAAA